MKQSPFHRDIPALVLLLAVATCDGRSAIPEPTGGKGARFGAGANGGVTNQGGAGGSAGSVGTPAGGSTFTGEGLQGGAGKAVANPYGGAGGTAPTSTGYAGAGGAQQYSTGFGGIGGYLMDGPAPWGGGGTAPFADPNGGGGGQLWDSGPYSGVAKDPMDRCPCSRALGRANPPEHFLCPPGTGEKVGVMVGPGGGTVDLPGHGTFYSYTEIAIPPGALSAWTFVTITELTGLTPTGYTDLSPVFAIEPTGLLLAKRAKVTIPWDIYLAAGFPFINPKQSFVYASASPSSGFAPLADSGGGFGVDTGTVDRFGYVFAGYPATLDPPFCTAP
jgi:hypothetical protein